MSRPAFDPRVDYYGLLGVESSATPTQIHSAYRRLARAYHPDIHPGSAESIVRMARLNVAKSILLDGATRAAYDLSRDRIRNSGESIRARNSPDVSARAAHARASTPRSPWSFDRNAALMLVIVAPLVIALLVYVLTGAQVAAEPVPFLVC
jgi:curved DNA-binding protein CbpA